MDPVYLGEKNATRLSDRIMYALELSLEQDDVETSEVLFKALELSMTQNTGGGDFIERRNYPEEMEKAYNLLLNLRAQKDK